MSPQPVPVASLLPIMPFHSREFDLLKVTNDLLFAAESGVSIMVLLNLTAASDTVDQTLLMEHLEHCVGIVLNWLIS